MSRTTRRANQRLRKKRKDWARWRIPFNKKRPRRRKSRKICKNPRPPFDLVVAYLAQDGVCSICEGRMPPLGSPCDRQSLPTRDHVVPRTAGGKEITAAHSLCNSRKGDRDPTPFELAWLERVRRRKPHLVKQAVMLCTKFGTLRTVNEDVDARRYRPKSNGEGPSDSSEDPGHRTPDQVPKRRLAG